MINEIDIKGKKYLFFDKLQLIFEGNSDILGKIKRLKESKYPNDANDRMIANLIDTDTKVGSIMCDNIKTYIENNDINLNSAQINIQYGCNLSCKYCFAGDGCHNKKGRMDIETAHNIMNYVKNNSKNIDSLYIQIVGGEPFLNIEAFEEIVKYSKKIKGMKANFTTTTNGTLFDDYNIKFLDENSITYMVSLDSNDKKTHDFLRTHKITGESSFEKILQGYNKYSKTSNYDTIHVTITPYNLNISEIANNLYDAGISHIHFELVKSDKKEFLFNKDHMDILKNEYDILADIIINRISKGEKINCHPLIDNIGNLDNRKPVKFKCGVLMSMLAFDPFGYIYPCDMLMWDKYKLGNIKDGLDKDKLNELKQVLKEEGNCADCFARYLCGGMCLAEKLNENKEQNELICDLKRYIYKLRIYIYDNLKKKNVKLNMY